MFFWAEERGLPVEEGRTIVVNTIVGMEIFYLFSVRSLHGGALSWRWMLGTPALWIGIGITVLAQIAFTYLSPLQLLFDTRAISFADCAAVAAVGLGLLIIVEIEKRIRRAILRR
jgi:magnesium-transporting ATPase (P-type)